MSQSKNRNQLNESLSALMDDEASEFEVHRLLSESQQDAGVRERWHRYQLARAALTGEAIAERDTGFADGIRHAIADVELEQAPAAGEAATPAAAKSPAGAFARRWKSSAGRVAIAASVAGAVLIGSQQVNLLGSNTGPASGEFVREAMEPAPSAPSSVNIPTINVQNVSGGDAIPSRSGVPQGLQYSPNTQQQQLQDEQIRRYIRQLMLEHAEHSAQNSGSGLLPYARVPVEDDR